MPVSPVATGKDPIFFVNRKRKVYSNFLNSLFLTRARQPLEQVVGIEPTSSAWKADILAFVRYLHHNHICINHWGKGLSPLRLTLNNVRDHYSTTVYFKLVLSLILSKQVFHQSFSYKFSFCATNNGTRTHVSRFLHLASLPLRRISLTCNFLSNRLYGPLYG